MATEVFTDLFFSEQSSKQIPKQSVDRKNFQLVSPFIAESEADALFAHLLNEVLWADEYVRMFGRSVRSPRRVCWYGDSGTPYVYSGRRHEATGWLPVLETLRDRLVIELGAPFNFVLANLYEDHQDSMGWHSDNEPELGAEPVIASVSLGATRTFKVRPANKTPGQRRTSCSLALSHGSLLVMAGNSQARYQHALPKVTQSCGPRINLTFRQVQPRDAAIAGSRLREHD